jgi:hypothetical protein
MSTATNGCSYFTRLFARVQSSIRATLKIKAIPGLCILVLFAAIFNTGSANANILTSLSGTEAHVTNNVFEAFNTEVQCGDGSLLTFHYRQRMVINGKVEMVLSEFILDVGTYDLTFLGECNGNNLYGLGTCACKTTAFTNTSIMDIESIATLNIETAPQVIFFKGQIHSMEAGRPAGFLCIRKGDKNNSSIL